MKTLKRLFGACALMFGLFFGNAAHAGIPVIDVANLAQAIQQVTAWAQQATQMANQLSQMEQQYNSMTGNRGMGGLVPETRNYLPSDYQTLLNNGVGNYAAIQAAMQRFNLANTSLDSGSDTVQGFNAANNQAALNRASAESVYNEASRRFGDMQQLIDKINNSPDPKDIADLQGRIQAEQVMMQNESNKLQSLAQLAQAQQAIQTQQTVQLRMKSTKGTMPSGY